VSTDDEFDRPGACGNGCGDDDFDVVDNDAVQATVLAAAIDGNSKVRARLASLASAFEEPYRTVAGIANTSLLAGQFLDRHTLQLQLANQKVFRPTSTGIKELNSTEVMNLIFSSPVQVGQAEAYLEVLEEYQSQKLGKQLKEQMQGLVQQLGDQPLALLAEIERLAAAKVCSKKTDQSSELMEIIPYMQRLVGQQRGNEFLGLDCGFQHLNYLCNGLDTGLLVLAAPPGRGKTTLAWQLACQVAQLNCVPIIFVSMEQSKDELRAKALSRLSKLQYRHILRGRLQSTDAGNIQKLLDAAQTYALFGRHITVVEGDENTTVDVIQQIAQARLAETGADRCFILIDYLQILPIRERDTDRVTNTKERIDLHVSSLRRLARRLDSPVLAISAENRAGYTSRKLDVFKESGGIEYSADIAMILNREGKNKLAKDAEYVALVLTIVKNRNGERGVVKFKFYAERAEFVEIGREELVEDDAA
jgi:replicative DNA helicase